METKELEAPVADAPLDPVPALAEQVSLPVDPQRNQLDRLEVWKTRGTGKTSGCEYH